jgi:hypothetical protein
MDKCPPGLFGDPGEVPGLVPGRTPTQLMPKTASFTGGIPSSRAGLGRAVAALPWPPPPLTRINS